MGLNDAGAMSTRVGGLVLEVHAWRRGWQCWGGAITPRVCMVNVEAKDRPTACRGPE